MEDQNKLTDRQRREIDYHQEHARLHRDRYKSISYELVLSTKRKWWNEAWVMYDKLLELQLSGKKVLVVGCGFGDDAFRIAKMGAEVYACDLSPDVLEVAERVCQREKLSIRFAQMAAENLNYPNDFFDCVVIRDILHHVEISRALSEIVRVSSKGAVAIVNEVYTHSHLDQIRHSRFVERHLYGRMQKIVYGAAKPYITEDERKLDQSDLDLILHAIDKPVYTRYFDFLVNRCLPIRYKRMNQLDFILLTGFGPFAMYLGGRVLLVGRIKKTNG